jgi:hypothetical protein
MLQITSQPNVLITLTVLVIQTQVSIITAEVVARADSAVVVVAAAAVPPEATNAEAAMVEMLVEEEVAEAFLTVPDPHQAVGKANMKMVEAATSVELSNGPRMLLRLRSKMIAGKSRPRPLSGSPVIGGRSRREEDVQWTIADMVETLDGRRVASPTGRLHCSATNAWRWRCSALAIPALISTNMKTSLWRLPATMCQSTLLQ